MRGSAYIVLLATVLVGFLPNRSAAQAPPGGVPLLGTDATASLQLTAAANLARLSEVAAPDLPSGKAKRFETLAQPSNEWDVQADAWSKAPVAVGDIVLASVYIRVVPGAGRQSEGRATFQFETEGPSYAKSAFRDITAGKAWKRYFIPFEIKYASATGKAHIGFRLGFAPQTVDIGEFAIVNYGRSVKLSDLPNTSTSYLGDSPDAPWRVAANQRIEQLRKGDLELRLLNSAGVPVKDAKIQVRMKRHAFGFGSCVAANLLFEKSADADRYRSIIKSNYNIATIENHLKWPFYETWGKTDGLNAVKWFRNNNIRLRAHNIIWPGWSNLPDDLPNLKNDKAALTNRINRHITEMTTATYGMADEWDVLNEAYTNHDLMDILGWNVVADWFRRTRQGDPRPRLVINDWPTLDGAATGDDHLNQFYNLIGDLQAQKAPVEAIGFQCHFGGAVVPPERVLSGLDRFAKFGLPIEITEFDMDTSDTDLQARYMRDFMTAAFSHPSVDEIVMWGFWENAHWLPSAALYTKDWKLRPHGQVWLDLVKRDWTTNVDGKTDARGSLKLRAFYGDYEVTVVTGNRTKVFPITLAKGTKSIRLQVR